MKRPIAKLYLGIYSLLAIALLSPLAFKTMAQEAPRQAGSESSSESPLDSSENTYKYLRLFGDVFERVREKYVEQVSDEQLIKHAINGMLGNLDPHSAYLDEEDFKQMQVSTQGKFGGLGIEVTMENGFVKVVSPIDGTPAYRAGVVAGDLITHLDGKPVMGLSLSEAVKKMRGEVGTKIDITIRREGVKEPVEITITRDIIKIESVKHEIFDNIGYIRITSFNKNTQNGLKSAIEEIKSAAEKNDRNVIGYILDLRNNPGGLLNQAISVSDSFLNQGEIVSIRGRNQEDTKRDNATKGDLINGTPLIVLINSGSASASEIVAGAIQDHRRGIIMGTKSFGKGSVQTIIGLPENGAMRLTTARYYTPSGRSIQAKGIEPDILVKPARIEGIALRRRVREEDLRGALDNSESKEEQKDAPIHSSKAKNDDIEKDDPQDNESDEKLEDYQLARALDLLRGLYLYENRFE